MEGIRIGKIFGIPIEMHISFLLLIMLLFISGIIFGNLYIVFYILLLFFFVILHELSHSVVAIKFGVKIDRIILLPFGGVASMKDIPREPRKELRIAIAGPLVNFIVAFISLLILYAFGETDRLFPFFRISQTFEVFDIVATVFKINIILGVFNLFVPALPMDGGRVLRAVLAMKIGFLKATELSAGIAKSISIVMFIVGVLTLNIILILISFFVYIGAEQESKFIYISTLLSGLKVKDIMTTNVISVPKDMSLSELYAFMLKHRHMGYPVVDNGKVVGVVTFSDLSQVKREYWSKFKVEDIMSTRLITCSKDDEVLDALLKMNKENVGRLLVFENDKLIGIITRTDIIRAIEILRLGMV